MSFTLIETKTLASPATSIVFTSIPQTYTDLVLVASLRNDRAGSLAEDYGIFFNSDTSPGNYSVRQMIGTGSSILNRTNYNNGALSNSSGSTSNTFSNLAFYVPNYTSSTSKSGSLDAVVENNGTEAYQSITARLWTGTAAITTLQISNGDSGSSNNFIANTVVSLYGILKGSDGITTVS